MFNNVNFFQNCTNGNAVCATYICDINSMSVSDNVIVSIDAQVHRDTLRQYQVSCFRCTDEISYNPTPVSSFYEQHKVDNVAMKGFP